MLIDVHVRSKEKFILNKFKFKFSRILYSFNVTRNFNVTRSTRNISVSILVPSFELKKKYLITKDSGSHLFTRKGFTPGRTNS